MSYTLSAIRDLLKLFTCCTLAILFLITFSSNALSVPASPKIHSLMQPDGSKFDAKQWGDEWNHGWEAIERYTIIKENSTSTWVYATLTKDGTLAPTTHIVGKDPAPINTPLHLRPTVERRSKDSAIRSLPKLERYPKPAKPLSVVPATGTGNIPVILVNFSDTITTYTNNEFSTMLFGSSSNSLKDYYEEVSYGTFSVSAGPSGIPNWYQASKSHDYYGSNDASGYDLHPAELVIETVAAADAAIDFAPYDQDGDCVVDVVAIVHQGTGEEAGGVTTDIWSHRWDLFSANTYGDGTGPYTTGDTAACGSIIINDYIIQPETLYGGIQTIGVFAHEYGHALGLPDLYDTDYTSEGIGDWGLMAAGSWNSISRSGDSPAHLSAWSKYKLGWVSPTLVSSTLTDEAITEASSQADVYQLLSGSPSSGGEYFLIENRQQSGFDAGLPGVGLAIWHVDEAKSNNDNECETATGCSNHYKVALEQADGLFELDKDINQGNTGDLFISGKEFTPTTTPNSLTYDGTNNQLQVTNISSASSVMTATLSAQASVPVQDCIIQDPGFETGTPNSFWTEASTNFGTPLCDSGSCSCGGQVYCANSGSWWAWFGGISGVVEEGSLEQSVAIASNMKNISFYLAVPSSDTPGYIRLLVDGQQLWQVTDTTAAAYSSGYQQVLVDISAYADNGAHTVQFISHTNASGGATSFWIDDLCLNKEGSSFCWPIFLPAISNGRE